MPVISLNALASPTLPRRPANDPGAAPIPAALRERVRRLERQSGAVPGLVAGLGRAVPLGLAALDARLPEGGLAAGAVHEIEAGLPALSPDRPLDGATLGFAALMLGRFSDAACRQGRPGTLLWVRRPRGVFDAPPYAPGLVPWLDPARLLLVTVDREEDLFWVLEEALRTPGIAAVLGESRGADLTAARRLSLAAEKNGVPALLLHPRPAPPQGACATRWRVRPLPSRSTPGLRDLGPPRWRLELRRNRFGAPSAEEIPTWDVEWSDEARHLAVVPQTVGRASGPSGPGHNAARLVG